MTARERAQHIVANWRVNFDHDDDNPLINMIESNLKILPADRVRQAARDLAAEFTGGTLPADMITVNLQAVLVRLERVADRLALGS